MGIIDSAYFRLTCGNCDNAETVVAHDKGSTWSGSSWNPIGKPQGFTISQRMEKSGPEITAAICDQCESRATWEEAYSRKPGW